MEFQIEPIGPCRKRISVKIPSARVTEEFDKSYRNLAKSVPIPGFRQGKAPRKLVEKRYGEQVTGEVREALLGAAFEEAVQKNKLAPIADPEIDVEKIEVKPAQDLGFEFTITVKPEFELPDLKGIEVSVPPAVVAPAMLDEELLALRKRRATLRPRDEGPAQPGDVATLRVRGAADGEEVIADDSMPYEIGSRLLGDLVTSDLDAAILGKGAGDVVQATAFVPPHFESHPLGGREISIHAEILDVKWHDIPELDDALAESLGADSADAVRERASTELRARLERVRERAIEELALGQLLESTAFELPDDLIRKEIDDLARRAAYDMQLEGKQEEEIAKRVSEIRTRRAEESTREMKAFFILDKLVEKERILVTETEVKNAVAMLAAYSQKAPEQMYAMLRDSGRLASLRNQLRENKARARLRAKVKVTEAAPPPAGAPASPQPPQRPKKA